jgi:hypothetical protein
MIITFTFPNPIAQEIRECMSVECGPLFIIDKLPWVWYCSDGTCVNLGGKQVVKWQFIWAVGTGIWSLSECHTKIPSEEYNVKLERGDSLKPTVISDSLNESSCNSVVRIVNFATSKDVIPKGTPSKHLRMHLDLSGWEDSCSYRSHIERLEMASVWCPSCLQYWSLFGGDIR